MHTYENATGGGNIKRILLTKELSERNCCITL